MKRCTQSLVKRANPTLALPGIQSNSIQSISNRQHLQTLTKPFQTSWTTRLTRPEVLKSINGIQAKNFATIVEPSSNSSRIPPINFIQSMENPALSDEGFIPKDGYKVYTKPIETSLTDDRKYR